VIENVIWTGGASQDYLAADSHLASSQAIDAIIELLRLLPDMGAPVSKSQRIRRVLVGRKRIYGLYYASTGARLIVLALIDLRQNPAKIEEFLKSRGIEN